MSGDTPCGLEAIWVCPFCGKPTWKIQIPEQFGTFVETGEQDGSDGVTKYDSGLEITQLVLRIECEDTKKGNSVEYDCPAMMEGGAYYLHIRPEGDHHAYYY